MNVEILYVDGCPNHHALVAHMGDLLRGAEGIPELTLRRVDDDGAAQRERFLGSPSVRVDGRDIEPGADERTDYGMKCRLYRTAEGLIGMPPDEWLLNAFGVGSATAGPAIAGIRTWAAQRAAGLSAPERQLHRRILRAFGRGGAPSAADLSAWSAELDVDLGDVTAALARNDLVHCDPRTGAVAVAYPFSQAPTRHRVRLASGVEVFAMCAIDALGIGFMLHEPTHVISSDPGTGEPIEVSLPLTEGSAWSPREAVVIAGCEGNGTSLNCTCPHTTFAASPEHARRLLAAGPAVAGDVLCMADAIARGREFFGGLLAADDQDVTPRPPPSSLGSWQH